MEQNYIHEITILPPKEYKLPDDAPHLLLIHGFASSGTLFYKLVADLRKFFKITMIDLLGMGCSGRPEFSTKIVDDSEKVINYFIVSIEAWMIASEYKDKVGTDRGFVLVGHSLGGYLSVHYTLSEYN